MNNSEFYLADAIEVIEEVLASGGEFRMYPKGTSMLPLIVQTRDSVVLKRNFEDGAKKHDIAFYRRRNGQFVLHRVMDICDDGTYTMCGDNQTELEKGIEKVSKVMMPALVVLTAFIAIYTICTMDGAWDGVVYYVKPDFSNFTVMTVVAAMGQLFYSMSLAMGIMITFGSYMKKDINIEKSVKQIEIFDTGVAFLAGLMIIPAVYAFSGGNEEALATKGAGLMFETLPAVFKAMPGGTVIGAFFFFMVLLAAITSSISLMETIVSIFMDKLKVGRRTGCLIVLGFSLLIGVPASLGYSAWSGVKVLGMQMLDLFDFISNSIMMPIIAVLTCIFVSFIIKPRAVVEELEISGKFKWKHLFEIVIKYVAPVCLVAILASSILESVGVIKI